jgi:hypothetical protein
MNEIKAWIERRFDYRPDAGTFAQVVERLAGAPARVEEKSAVAPREILTRRIGDAWSIQEHIGHLWDVEVLWATRLDEFVAGAPELTAADMSNQGTRAANHNERPMSELTSGFRNDRAALVGRLEELDDALIVREALHPRLAVPMRVIDLCVFVAEHDDHHLAKMSETWRVLTGATSVALPTRRPE